MNRIRHLAVALVLFLSLGTTLPAQAPDTVPASQLTPAAPAKDPATAAILEWLIPTVGYAYAGDWTRGLLPAAVRVGGAAVFISDQFVLWGDPPPCRARCTTGVVMLVGGSVWSFVGAARTARRYNERHGSIPTVTLVPQDGRLALSAELRF